MSNYPAGVPNPREERVLVRCTSDDCPTALANSRVCDECGGAKVTTADGGVTTCAVCDGRGRVCDPEDRETYEGFGIKDLGALWLQGDAEECRVCGAEVEVL